MAEQMNLDSLLPRRGLLGAWDRIVGPGMTRAENALVIGSALAGGLLAGLRMAQNSSSGFLVGLAALIGLDVIGGAICNATVTTRAWYHRPGQGLREHLLFVAPHLIYIAAVAGLARGRVFDAPYACIFALGVVAGSLAILSVPNRLKCPVAFAAFLVVLSAVTTLCGQTRGMEWFAPALLLKLLVGHLVPASDRHDPVATG